MFGCSCILMIIGAQVDKRSLMIPYLVIQMVIIVFKAVVGIPIASVLFYKEHPLFGISVSIFVLITSILPIYYWCVVKSAYNKLGERRYLITEKDYSII